MAPPCCLLCTGTGKPPLAPTFYQLAMRAVQEQQLVVGGPLDPGLISAHQVRAILQLHGAMPARTLFNLARIKPIGDAGNASYGSVLSGLQERLPAGVCFHTATVSARGSATLRSDTTWVALSQQQLVDANNNLKVAECGIAQERAERVLEQVGPTLEQCEVRLVQLHCREPKLKSYYAGGEAQHLSEQGGFYAVSCLVSQASRLMIEHTLSSQQLQNPTATCNCLFRPVCRCRVAHCQSTRCWTHKDSTTLPRTVRCAQTRSQTPSLGPSGSTASWC